MHDSGFASSQPEISDAQRLVQAFPAWCASKGITAANAQRFDGTVKNGSAGSLKMMEWENNKLVALWLDQNKITSLPDSIGNLKELTHLDLTSNQLSSLPASLGGLSNLQGLFVGRNKLTVVTEQIGSLKGLLKLYVFENPESNDMVLTQIVQVAQLQPAFNAASIDWKPHEAAGFVSGAWVGHNKLTVVPEWTGNLKELTNLDFEANQISEFPESIGELTKLQELYLYGNPVSTDQLKAFITPYK
nr:hypothetical protein HK105_001850 [Polyrhizophydium stewartii]